MILIIAACPTIRVSHATVRRTMTTTDLAEILSIHMGEGLLDRVKKCIQTIVEEHHLTMEAVGISLLIRLCLVEIILQDASEITVSVVVLVEIVTTMEDSGEAVAGVVAEVGAAEDASIAARRDISLESVLTAVAVDSVVEDVDEDEEVTITTTGMMIGDRPITKLVGPVQRALREMRETAHSLALNLVRVREVLKTMERRGAPAQLTT